MANPTPQEIDVLVKCLLSVPVDFDWIDHLPNSLALPESIINSADAARGYCHFAVKLATYIRRVHACLEVMKRLEERVDEPSGDAVNLQWGTEMCKWECWHVVDGKHELFSGHSPWDAIEEAGRKLLGELEVKP